ncbi:hypothetical protein EDB92DRAFT_1851546 [Lactarius akahatsu]|uniref:Uncharacterized protein n=1 Tax=Lactarius akahatsu TaxID=416441 RepID=A0AAD4LKA9_9AGAM|nr:hypothetical protein EDB92DRAFT_1851546 [Lactarius akahatsu]
MLVCALLGLSQLKNSWQYFSIMHGVDCPTERTKTQRISAGHGMTNIATSVDSAAETLAGALADVAKSMSSASASDAHTLVGALTGVVNAIRPPTPQLLLAPPTFAPPPSTLSKTKRASPTTTSPAPQIVSLQAQSLQVLTSRSGPEVRAKLSFRARWKSSGVSSNGGFLDTRKST